MLLFPLALLPLALALPLGAAIVLYGIQGIVPPATNPLLDEIVLQEADPALHGAASSWRNGATESAGLVGAAAGGMLLDHASFAVLFAVAAAVSLAGGGALVAQIAGFRIDPHPSSPPGSPDSPTRPRITR
jgi:predicted MFS family arabinose efflux permease